MLDPLIKSLTYLGKCHPTRQSPEDSISNNLAPADEDFDVLSPHMHTPQRRLTPPPTAPFPGYVSLYVEGFCLCLLTMFVNANIHVNYFLKPKGKAIVHLLLAHSTRYFKDNAWRYIVYIQLYILFP